MSLRRVLNENPAVTTAISIVLLLLALAAIGYQLWPRGGRGGNVVPPTQEQPPRQNMHVQQTPGCPAPTQTVDVL